MKILHLGDLHLGKRVNEISMIEDQKDVYKRQAFQIQDDILDLTGDQEEIGKPVGSDEKNHKTTYVTLKGLERSQRDVEDISKKAIDILEKYDKGDCYLTNLTRFLIHRTH